MKDMFYKYDYQADVKDCSCEPVPCNHPKTLYDKTSAEIVYNLKGDQIGIKAKHGFPIPLYFTFFGEVDPEYENVSNFLNYYPIKLQVLDQFHNVLLEQEYINSVYNNMLCVDIEDKDNILKKDIYKIRLFVETEKGSLDLISENKVSLNLM